MGGTGQLQMAMGRIGAVMLVAAAVSGCAAFPGGTFDAYPVSGNPVSPTPAPDYRVQCQTVVYGPNILVFGGTTAICRQMILPPEAVISVRG